MFFLFLFVFILNENFQKAENRFDKIRKANTIFELNLNIENYENLIEKAKIENKEKDLQKILKKLEKEFNTSLIEKYKEVVNNLERNSDFFKLNENFKIYKDFLMEIDTIILGTKDLENFNDEIIKKLSEIQKSYKDPCVDFFYRYESSTNNLKRIEYLFKIGKSPCLFSSNLKNYAREKLKEEKEKFLINLKNKKTFEEFELFLECFRDDKDFMEKISALKSEIKNEKEVRPKEKVSIEEQIPEELKKEIKENMEMGMPWIALDIWQSAWGDFSEIELLLNYIKRNKISEVNLNIGKEITEKKETKVKAKEILKRIVPKLYEAGAKKVNLLYAELNYSVENYASFLSENKDLQIDKIVDDSEFTDLKISHYSHNSSLVKKYGLKYSVFVTVEKKGNSGVSDETRYYLIKEADEVILMSYFSCNFEKQIAELEKYFLYADNIGKLRSLKIALLFGTKSIGREKSCEYLGEDNISKFIYELHNWASNFSSYNGIVLETNKKLPPDIF